MCTLLIDNFLSPLNMRGLGLAISTTGIAAFEACSGVLMGAVLGLSSMTVSILFILPIPAAFFGAWFAGRPNKRFSTLMWQSVICCLLAGLLMWIPDWFGVMNVWTLLVPAALFFFGAGMLFPLATSGAMEPFPFLAGTAGALVGGLQNIGSGVLASLSAMLPQTGQGSLGLLMTLMGLLIVIAVATLLSRPQWAGVSPAVLVMVASAIFYLRDVLHKAQGCVGQMPCGGVETHQGYHLGLVVGVLRTWLGGLVVLGPGGKRVLHAMAGRHGADSLAGRDGKTRGV